MTSLTTTLGHMSIQKIEKDLSEWWAKGYRPKVYRYVGNSVLGTPLSAHWNVCCLVCLRHHREFVWAHYTWEDAFAFAVSHREKHMLVNLHA